MPQIDIGALVPGGVRPTDHVHRITNDDTCSRCRKPVPEDEVPLMLWVNGDEDMLIYCQACTGPEAHAALAPSAPAGDKEDAR